MSDQKILPLSISDEEVLQLVDAGNGTFHKLAAVTEGVSQTGLEAIGAAVLYLTFVLAHVPKDARHEVMAMAISAILAITTRAPGAAEMNAAANVLGDLDRILKERATLPKEKLN